MKTGSVRIFRLGVTGGIGSGKTSVCRVFNVLRIPVFSADRTARELMDHDFTLRRCINTIAGRDLYTEGSLDRMALASLIFSNESLLARVNALVHPMVFNSFLAWSEQQSAPYVIMEAAILFESGASEFVDRKATVVASEEERINRVVLRSKMTREQVLDRMKNQMDDETRIQLSDFVIPNSENDMVIPAVLKIHGEILQIVKNKD
jgi:dephospho-CoA kinase